MGTLAAIGLLAAERHRSRTGEGQLVGSRSPTSPSRWSATSAGSPRPSSAAATSRKDGNYLYGAFGHDFETARRPARDGRRAHRPPVARAGGGDRDRSSVRRASSDATGHDLNTETGRYEARDLIAAILRPWFAARTLAEVRERFAGTGVSWGPYQTFRQLVDEDPRCSPDNPMFEEVEHPGVGRYLCPRLAA